MLRPDVPVLLHVPAGLPHEPHRPNVGRPAAAGIEKAAVHWSHAHQLLSQLDSRTAQTFDCRLTICRTLSVLARYWRRFRTKRLRIRQRGLFLSQS